MSVSCPGLGPVGGSGGGPWGATHAGLRVRVHHLPSGLSESRRLPARRLQRPARATGTGSTSDVASPESAGPAARVRRAFFVPSARLFQAAPLWRPGPAATDS